MATDPAPLPQQSRDILTPKTPAPNFTLNATPDQKVSLSDLRGKPVVLAFYPADWSPVCGDQMALYNEILPEFHRHQATLIGISVDGAWCHAAFAAIGSCTSRCCPTSSRRVRWPEPTVRTARSTAPRSE